MSVCGISLYDCAICASYGCVICTLWREDPSPGENSSDGAVKSHHCMKSANTVSREFCHDPSPVGIGRSMLAISGWVGIIDVKFGSW